MTETDPPVPGGDQVRPPGYPPPPGWSPAGPPPPGGPPPLGPGGRPPTSSYGASYASPPRPQLGPPLHKPGTVPLRPLTLVDFFDGAFATIRRNPGATIGVGALVTTAFMLVPIVGALVLAGTGQFTGGLFDANATSGTPTFGDVSVIVASAVSGIFAFLANIVVAGLIVPVVTRAAIGEYISGADAWRQVRGRLPRLVALALLELVALSLLIAVPVLLAVLLGAALGSPFVSIALGIVLGVGGALSALAVHTRWFQLAAPSLVVERRGISAAVRRAGRLSRSSFWRILGVVVLVALSTYIVKQVIGVPFSLVGLVLANVADGGVGTAGLLLATNLATIVSGAVVAPFAGAVAVLQYLDQRFRKEGFDIELINHVSARRPPAR